MQDNLGPQVRPRTFFVQEARNKLSSFVLGLQGNYGLTDLEVLGILNEIAATTIRFALREERHPDEPGKPADRL